MNQNILNLGRDIGYLLLLILLVVNAQNTVLWNLKITSYVFLLECTCNSLKPSVEHLCFKKHREHHIGTSTRNINISLETSTL